MHIFEVEERTPILLQQLLTVWEKAVRKTHLFLSNAEIEEIRAYVPQALQEVPHLVVAENDSAIPIAFMGIAAQKLEMLFVTPEERAKGYGKKLLQYGIAVYDIRTVMVNEQKPLAKGFYNKGRKTNCL